MEVEAPCFCFEDIEDSLDSCVKLERVVRWLMEVDLFGTADGVDIVPFRQPGSLLPDSKV